MRKILRRAGYWAVMACLIQGGLAGSPERAGALPPENDSCDTARSITTLPYTDVMDSTEATADSGDPATCAGVGSNSVWYAVSSPDEGLVYVSTPGSDYDTVLAVYKGTCDGLTSVACNDDFLLYPPQSATAFYTCPGEVHYVLVTQSGATPGGGALHLNASISPVTGGSRVCKAHDSVVLPIQPLNVTIGAGKTETVKILKALVRNADSDEAEHRIAVSVDASDCPDTLLAGEPDFEAAPGAQSSTVVPAGKVRAAKIPLTIRSAAFDSVKPKAPKRCTLLVSAAAAVDHALDDPTPSNNQIPVEINVIDKNDPAQTAVHESVVDSLAPVSLTIKPGQASKSIKLKAKLGNADARESPGDELFAVAADGTCPAGTVGVVDHQGTTGIQSSVVVPGSAKKPATLPLTATSSASTPNKLSPQRCVATVSVTGPSGDLDGSNNVTQLVIDILDKNDF